MARNNINIGIVADDGTGDTLRSAGNKINRNVEEIYTNLGDSSNFYQYPIKAWGVVYIPSGDIITPSSVGILTSSPGVTASIVPYSSIGGVVRVSDGLDAGVFKIDFPDMGTTNYCALVSVECKQPAIYPNDGDHLVNVVNKTSSSIWVSNMDTSLTSVWGVGVGFSLSAIAPNPDNFQGGAIANGAIHFAILK